MGRILAGIRIVFKTVGMRIEGGEEHTIKLDTEHSPAEHPRAFAYFGNNPPWGGVEVPVLPAFATPGEQVRVRVKSLVGEETEDSPPLFAAIVVEKEFNVNDALLARWVANPDEALGDVHSAIGNEVKAELGPRAVTLAALLATRYSQGVLAEKVWEGVLYHFTEKELRTVFGPGLIRIFDLWDVTDENVPRAFDRATFPLLPARVYPVSELLQRVARAAHWLVAASGEKSPTNRFLAHFMVLETLSRLAPGLPAPSSLPAPWNEREKDLKEFEELAKAAEALEVLSRIAARLSGTRYGEPSLSEGFDRLVDLHPSHLKDSDKRLFRRLSEIRNNLLHGRVHEPPSILVADSPTAALEDLAVSALRATFTTVSSMAPGQTLRING